MQIFTEQDYSGRWWATDENYDGDPEMNYIVGHGKTEFEAISHYLGEYAERHNIDDTCIACKHHVSVINEYKKIMAETMTENCENFLRSIK